MDAPVRATNFTALSVGAAVGLGYGLLVRYGLQAFPNNQFLEVMTVGFIIFLPFAMGFTTVFIIEWRRPQPVWTWFLYPWIPVVAAELGTMAAAWEGAICVVLLTPIALSASTAGGVAAALLLRIVRSRRSKQATLMCVMGLPFLVGSIEPQFLPERDVRSVESVIDIHASPAIVWQNIERVPRIQTSELPSSWSHAIGFPNPVEATLSAEAVGGVRHASFEKGVLFIETIDTWEPEHRLGFSIRAQADQIPKTTLDEHVTIGGQFFDVLHGEYVLEPLAGGVTRLHLISRHRVSTDFNWYAHLWTDALMRDLQTRILFVVRDRCESAARNR